MGLLNSPSLYLLSHTQSPSTTRRIPCYPPFLHVPSSFYFSFLTLFPSPLPLSFKLFFLLLYYPTIPSLTSFYTIPILFFLPTVSSLFSLPLVTLSFFLKLFLTPSTLRLRERTLERKKSWRTVEREEGKRQVKGKSGNCEKGK